MTKKDSIFLDDKKVIKLIGLIIAGLIGGFFLLENLIPKSSNNATLAVEIGVGFIIAIIVYRTTKKYEKQNLSTLTRIQETEKEQSNLIKEMKPIIEKQGKIIEEQREIWNAHRVKGFRHAKYMVNSFITFLEDISPDDCNKTISDDSIDMINFLRNNLSYEIPLSRNYLEPDIMYHIDAMYDYYGKLLNYKEFSDHAHHQTLVKQYVHVLEQIESQLKK